MGASSRLNIRSDLEQSPVRFGDGNISAELLLRMFDYLTLHRGALVKLTSNESILDTTSTPIPWDEAEYDTGGFWSASSPTRLTIPEGVTRVRLLANIRYANDSDGNRQVWISKNDNVAYVGRPMGMFKSGGVVGVNLCSTVIDVVIGDYFEVRCWQDSGGPLNVESGDVSWFALEIVE